MSLFDSLISLLAPHRCVICRSEGDLVCDWCKYDVLDGLPARCYRCKKVSSNSRTCSACRRTSPLSHVWVASEYNSTIKELIERFKFGRTRGAATYLADWMEQSLPHLSSETIITHLPTATQRRRQRGYDQAELLARQVAKQRRLTHRTLLARSGQTRQVGSSRQQRLKQLAAAYRPIRPDLIKKAHIILIDDVTTTGTSLEVAARVLKQAGAKQVDALVCAQKSD